MPILNFIEIISLSRIKPRRKLFWKENVGEDSIPCQLLPSRINRPSTHQVVLIHPWRGGIIVWGILLLI
jgi:hypothetical protein